MTTTAATIGAEVELGQALHHCTKVDANTCNLLVVDSSNILLGVVPLAKLLSNERGGKVADIMEAMPTVAPTTPASEVVLLLEKNQLLSVPVVDNNRCLLGQVGIFAAIASIRDSADHSIMSMAGLDEAEDMFMPVLPSARRRAAWLGVNLLAAILASWVIGWFEATLQQIVILAVLMPIVASMGGIAGMQTLTLMVRALALRQIADTDTRRLLINEIAIGLVNGITWALVAVVLTSLVFSSVSVGVLLGAALIINLVCAAIAGAALPLLLNKLGIDPALAGGVLLTTITDCIGFFAFLGLATVFLL